MENKGSKYVKFIEKLIALTRSTDIEWEYLDHDFDLAEKAGLTEDGINDMGNEDTFLLVDSENSFYCDDRDNNMFLILYTKNSEVKLMLVPNTYKGILTINESDCPGCLIRLLNMVKSQFPNPQDYMDTIIDL